jgi:hypothetical protein
VTALKSTQEEGMSSQVADYATQWIEAQGQRGKLQARTFTVVLGIDGISYLDGQKVGIVILN